MHETLPLLINTDFPTINRKVLDTIQVNLGYKCNQQCLHCHVNAGPNRTENMQRHTVNEILCYMEKIKPTCLDLTGGAPELNPNFQYFISESKKLGVHIIDRCNLSILFEPGQENLAEFLAENNVEIVASLPCYIQDNVDTQRGKGVFQKSIKALQLLNNLGYGKQNKDLQLNLVYNPIGPYLPPAQDELEKKYKVELYNNYNINFNHLLTITNMPIKRFGSTLISKGQFNDYLAILKNAHNCTNLKSVMCRNLISINWQGYIFDCDFNQMLDLPMELNGYSRPHIKDLIEINIENNKINIADHCYACTAGNGSSCSGALAQ